MLIVAGIPASGKSTVARRFGRVLEFDDIAERFGLYGGGGDEEREIVSRQFALLAASGLYDAAVDVFPTRESRRRILEYARQNKLMMAGMHLPPPGFVKTP